MACILGFKKEPSEALAKENGWGAGIRTPDHGTRTRCLTTWPHPNNVFDV